MVAGQVSDGDEEKAEKVEKGEEISRANRGGVAF